METIGRNTRKSRTSEPNKPFQNLLQIIYLKSSDKDVALYLFITPGIDNSTKTINSK